MLSKRKKLIDIATNKEGKVVADQGAARAMIMGIGDDLIAVSTESGEMIMTTESTIAGAIIDATVIAGQDHLADFSLQFQCQEVLPLLLLLY